MLLFAEAADWVLALQGFFAMVGILVPAVLVYMTVKLQAVQRDLLSVKKIVDGQQSARQVETDDLKAAAMLSMESKEPITAAAVIAAADKKAAAIVGVVKAANGTHEPTPPLQPSEPGAPVKIEIVPASKPLPVKETPG